MDQINDQALLESMINELSQLIHSLSLIRQRNDSIPTSNELGSNSMTDRIECISVETVLLID